MATDDDERRPDERASQPPRSGGSSSNRYNASGSGRQQSGAPRKDGYKPRTDGSAPRKDAYKPRTSGGAPRTGGPQGGSGGSRGARPGMAGARAEGERAQRPERHARNVPTAPEIPEEIVYGQLDKTVRAQLRTLSKENAEDVGRHLIMAGLLIDDDPETAYRHAAVASSRAGRVDVVREAFALTAYATGRYAEALREFRTVRRLNGSSEHVALMADCERGLGRPERAIALAQEPQSTALSPEVAIELAMVVAGARVDMGDADAALVALKRLKTKDPELKARIDEATAEVLRALGRDEDADALTPPASVEPDIDEDVVVYDTAEVDLETQPDAPEPSKEDEAS